MRLHMCIWGEKLWKFTKYKLEWGRRKRGQFSSMNYYYKFVTWVRLRPIWAQALPNTCLANSCLEVKGPIWISNFSIRIQLGIFFWNICFFTFSGICSGYFVCKWAGVGAFSNFWWLCFLWYCEHRNLRNPGTSEASETSETSETPRTRARAYSPIFWSHILMFFIWPCPIWCLFWTTHSYMDASLCVPKICWAPYL